MARVKHHGQQRHKAGRGSSPPSFLGRHTQLIAGVLFLLFCLALVTAIRGAAEPRPAAGDQPAGAAVGVSSGLGVGVAPLATRPTSILAPASGENPAQRTERIRAALTSAFRVFLIGVYLLVIIQFVFENLRSRRQAAQHARRPRPKAPVPAQPKGPIFPSAPAPQPATHRGTATRRLSPDELPPTLRPPARILPDNPTRHLYWPKHRPHPPLTPSP